MNIERRVREKAIRKIDYLPVDYYSLEPDGKIVSKISSDSNGVRTFYMTMYSIMNALVNIISVYVGLIILEPILGLIILAIVELCKLNIRDFFNSIREFFKRDVKTVYKVMLVDAMRGQGVTNEFVLVNKGMEYKVVPSFCENVLESKPYVEIGKIIEDKIKIT